MFTINQLPNMNKAFILFILIALISCDQKENDLAPLVDTYPMAIGTEWTYDRQLILDKYESETSDKIIGTDTFHFVVRVWIDKDTILGTMPVKAFKCQEEHINSISTQFKFIDKNLCLFKRRRSNCICKEERTYKITLALKFCVGPFDPCR